MAVLTPASPHNVAGGFLDAKHDHGAVGDGVHDDTAALQNWINAAISTGQSGWLPAGTYKISAALVVNGNCTLIGAGVRELWGSFTSLTAFPVVSPHLTGAVIVQSALNTDAIQITGVGCSVNLENFGIKFGTLYANTGHGINCQPPIRTALANSGLTASVWKNLAVYGHDGNHYAYRLVNPQVLTRNSCRSYGGGGTYIRSESDGDVSYFYGNMVDVHPYHVVILAGGTHGFELSSAGGNAPLDQLCFLRPQAWVMNDAVDQPAGTSPPTGSQRCFATDDTNTFMVTIVGADFENNVGSVCTWPNHECALVGASYIDGTTTGNQPSDGFLTVAGIGQSEGFFAKPGGQDEIRSYWTLVLGGAAQWTALPSLGANPATYGVVVATPHAGIVDLAVQGAASQTADLQQWNDSAGHTQLGVANAGTGAAPKWALRARAVANAESAAQTHTLGTYTGRSIQVLDDAGATIGWLPLYG